MVDELVSTVALLLAHGCKLIFSKGPSLLLIECIKCFASESRHVLRSQEFELSSLEAGELVCRQCFEVTLFEPG